MKKDFLRQISEGVVTEEIMAAAKAEYDKLEEKAAVKRAENAPLIEGIMNILKDNEDFLLTSAFAEELGINSSKASSILRALVDEGIAVVEDVKVPKKGMQKGYKLA